MARLARVVVPGYPHHITQRGNRRQQTFFCDEDYQAYIALMSEWWSRLGVSIWFYCLMPNHVHLIAVPESEDGLRKAIGEAHRRYTRRVNFREGWRGHLWQGGIFLFCDGQQISYEGSAICGNESRQGRPCKTAGPILLEQHVGVPLPQERRTG